MPGARVADGERVTLRTIEEEDVEFLQRANANPEIRFPLGTDLRSRGEVEEWIENGDDGDDGDHFLVCLDDDGGPGNPDEDDLRRIGTVSVTDADWRRPDLGYWLAPEVHGQGYGKEAVSLAIDHAFRSYDRPAVSAVAYDFNDASRGLLESLGFEQEGRRRKERFVDGEYCDTIQYGLLREEWEEQSAP